MGLQGVWFDPAAAAGVKFPSPAVRTEIQGLNPGNIAAGEVTEPKLADYAVSRRTIAPGAVGTVEIGTGQVDTPNYKDDSITGDKIQANAVTSENTGIGVVTATNSAGDAITLAVQTVTTAEYNALASPDSGTVYLITP